MLLHVFAKRVLRETLDEDISPVYACLLGVSCSFWRGLEGKRTQYARLVPGSGWVVDL